MSCLPAILLITGLCSLLSYSCKLLLCTATVYLQPHNPWSKVIKSYSPQHASPAKMLPSLAKDFYLPPQHRHGTSMMLSIFCSVLLCFIALCTGSRLTGWADLVSQPVGACVVDGVTSRAPANQGQGCMAHMWSTHAFPSHMSNHSDTHAILGVTVVLGQPEYNSSV